MPRLCFLAFKLTIHPLYRPYVRNNNHSNPNAASATGLCLQYIAQLNLRDSKASIISQGRSTRQAETSWRSHERVCTYQPPKLTWKPNSRCFRQSPCNFPPVPEASTSACWRDLQVFILYGTAAGAKHPRSPPPALHHIGVVERTHLQGRLLRWRALQTLL